MRGTAAAAAADLVALVLAGCTVPDPTTGPAPPRPSGEMIGPVAPKEPVRDRTAVPLALSVPAIGVASDRLIDLGVDRDGALEVPGDAVTPGWFDLSPQPGDAGPTVIAGHVNYRGQDGVFARLGELDTGDEIVVRRADGRDAAFTAYKVERYAKADFPTELVYGNTDGPELRLITCGGAFDRGSGHYVDNVVAYARFTGFRS